MRVFPTVVALCLGLYVRDVVCAQPSELVYQKRGSYSEGTSTIPSTGKVTLDLIAALIQHQEPLAKTPPKFLAMFFRPNGEAPSLSIRELEPLYFYQLGDVSNSSWKGAPIVHFEWPTDTVVARMTYHKEPLRLRHLGAVLRLGTVAPSKAETVAPVALYHTRPPDRALSYRFVFVPSQRVELHFRVYPEGKKTLAGSADFDSSLARQPETFLWKPDGRPDGWYRLDVTGHVLRNNDPVESHVRFYHRRELR